MPPVLFLPLQILIFFAHRAHSQGNPMRLYCPGDIYTSPSPFESTLFHLLEDLIAAAPFSPSLYLTDNATVSFPSSRIFALAQCRPDASALDCTDCLRRSAASVTIDSPREVCGSTYSATVGFDLCFLRYSDQPFYDVLDFNLSWWRNSDEIAPDPLHFFPRAMDLLMRLAQEASAAVDKFAVGISSDEGRRIYGMAWCMRDLSARSCMPCLRRVMDELSTEAIGAWSASLSCALEYETFPFFNLSFVTSATSPEAIRGGGDNFTSIHGNGDDSKTKWILGIAIFAAVALVLFSIIFILRLVRMKIMCMIFLIKEKRNIEHLRSNLCIFFELSTVRAATNNFSEENKLGEGGFGAVFRGNLRGGEEIAVKRLSKTSLQGIEELKNEVAFVAKLQHRNLVRLLGCCLEKEEKLLVYEFLPNKSIDKLLVGRSSKTNTIGLEHPI